MNKYKVEFTESQKFVIDVLANSEEEAKKLAWDRYDDIVANGLIHYHESGDRETELSYVYDVSGTDDPFNP
jgi:hypothetical protein